MDGNGRWAKRRGRPRQEGHRAGAEAVRRAVEAAPGLGVSTLTLYAFSADNWSRPPSEVGHLMRLLRVHLRTETEECIASGVRLSVIGRRDRLPQELQTQIEDTESLTRSGRALHLRLAVDYSSREALVKAAGYWRGPQRLSREAFGQAIAKATHCPVGTPDVDLLIRTGGEKRLSDFLLWESAYAELVFTPCLWPDFTAGEFESAVQDFFLRDRRYGGLSGNAVGGSATDSHLRVLP